MSIHTELKRLQEIMVLPPSEDLMDEVERICASEPACKLFWCERVENPKWFPLMVSKAWFINPPNLTRDGDTITQPAWIESIVLHRFAKVISTEVARVLASVPSSNNPRAGDQIVRVAAELKNVADIRIVRERVGIVLSEHA